MDNIKELLFEKGKAKVIAFCEKSGLPVPRITVFPKKDWKVGACAYYRPDTEVMRKWTKPGINICLEECAFPAKDTQFRQWSWPRSVIDRTPYGVLCHELGHHADWCTGEKKWSYGSEYCEQVMKESGEEKLTNYCPNPAEWFAEMFRLFVSNPELLRMVRTRTYAILAEIWKPLRENWLAALGENVPPRIVKSLRRKMGEDL